jgi:hypothetical protein
VENGDKFKLILLFMYMGGFFLKVLLWPVLSPSDARNVIDTMDTISSSW